MTPGKTAAKNQFLPLFGGMPFLDKFFCLHFSPKMIKGKIFSWLRDSILSRPPIGPRVGQAGANNKERPVRQGEKDWQLDLSAS
jgi:hypothetical protein